MTALRPGSPKDAGMHPERIERVRELAAGWVKSGETPSLVVLVARRGVIVLHEAFGCLGPEAGSAPLQRDALFHVASVTKPMTATAAMLLVEDGLLGLNRPVVDYLPELCGEGTDQVLVHHLLTHTSGFNDVTLIPLALQKIREGSVEFGPCEETQHPFVHQMLTVSWSAPLWKPPGVEMAYCNQNYALLGEIVRRLSGRSLDDFARERIFSPLGMMDSHYVVPSDKRSRIARAPADAAPPPFARPPNAPPIEEIPFAAAGVFSTAIDLAVFGQTFLNGGTYATTRLLSGPTVGAMTRNQKVGVDTEFGGRIYRDPGYGYGWFVDTGVAFPYLNGSLPAIGTFGHAGGGGASLWVDPEEEIVGVYLSILMKRRGLLPLWSADLFQNAVTSAVDD